MNTTSPVRVWTRNQREQFVAAYVECSTWSSTDDNGEPLDSLPAVTEAYSQLDAFDETAKEQMLVDCQAFIDANMGDLQNLDPVQAGHDFWLTRNHHGAGFWARGLGELGDRLSWAAREFGEVELYVGDDGLLYTF